MSHCSVESHEFGAITHADACMDRSYEQELIGCKASMNTERKSDCNSEMNEV